MDATVGTEQLHLTVCSGVVIHVLTRPDARSADHPQPWLLPANESCPGAPFQYAKDDKAATLTTAKVKVIFTLATGRLQFLTATGDRLLDEWKDVPRTYEPETLNGEATHRVVDRFSLERSEAIYGLGQHQSGVFNYRGSVIELGQQNTDIAIPFLVSTRGYGILWNTAALTYADFRLAINMNLDSLAGDGVDYFFLYGPEMDDLIHQYRNLTGHAPMLPRYAYGLVQSKDRYTSLDQILVEEPGRSRLQ
jgi:alpha-D-xyloside xylohydrolase